MSILVGTQLDLLSCLGAINGIAQVEDQEPIADYIWFVSQDADITPELYQYCESLFTKNLLILDLETYGAEMPENGAYKKKPTNARGYKKGTTEGLQGLALSPIYGDIRLLQLAALNSERVLVVDFKTVWERSHLSVKYREFLDWLIEKIKEFAKRKGVLIGHNIGFDLGFLRAKYGIKFWKAYDTMIMSQLLSAGILTHRHGLKDCCNRYLGIEIDKTEQSADNSLPLRNAQINYAASDIVNTGELFLVLKNEISIAGLDYVNENIEVPFTPALVEINYWGMPVDLIELDRQIKWYFAKLMEIDKEFVATYPFMNIRSSKTIAGIVEKINEKLAISKQQEIEDTYQESLNDDDAERLNKYQKEYLRQQAQLEELANASEEEVNKAISDIKKDEKTNFNDIKVIKHGSSKSDLALLNDHRVVQLVVDFRTVSIYLNYCQQVKQEIVWIEGVPRVSGSIRQLTRKGQGRTCSGNKKAPVKCQGINVQNPPQTAKAPQRLLDSGCPNLRAIFQAPRVFPIPKNPVFLLHFYYLLDVELLFCYLTMNMRTIDQDLPAAHLAIATYFSGETVIADAAKNKIDLHAITMKNVFEMVNDYAEYRHMDVKQITKINKDEEHILFKTFDKIRGICKNVCYGSLNRQSAPTLQNTIKVQQKEEVPLHICEGMIEAFPKVFPKIAGILDSLWKKANNRIVKIDEHDYGVFYDDDATFHTPGYRRRIYSFCKKNAYGRIYVSTSDVANCWLATEATIMKRAIARIYQRAVLEQNLDLRLGSICHDEVVATCYQYQATDCSQIIKEETLLAMQHFTWDHENNKPKLPYPAMEKPAYKLVRDGWSH